MNVNLPDKIRKLKDDAWLNLLIKSIHTPVIEGVEFPGFPSDTVQTEFVGSANEHTLREAYNFYVLVKKYAHRLHQTLGRGSRFLDFGCGWGRYQRFFWKDVDVENLYGCDVHPGIVETCRELNIPGQIDLIQPLGSLPYPDNFFDVIMAYSVFTHLPEKVHMHWVKELARVARPGAVFCLTLEPLRFLDFIAAIPDDTPSDWYRILSRHKPRLEEFRRQLQAGGMAFMPSNPGVEETYGDAVVPPAYIDQNWTPYFTRREYIDNPRRFWQAVLVAQRTKQD